MTHSADTAHSISLARMERCGQYIGKYARWENSLFKRELVAAFEAAVMGTD